MAGITPLNNFLGPESDPVTVATQLPSTKYQATAIYLFGLGTLLTGLGLKHMRIRSHHDLAVHW